MKNENPKREGFERALQMTSSSDVINNKQEQAQGLSHQCKVVSLCLN